MRADELFVFVGAGASFGAPAGRPLFPEIRRDVLSQVLGTDPPPGSDRVAPERFMQVLQDADIDAAGYLRAVLSDGSPNAVHHALAQLAARGARVWTVNFDPHIENADPALAVSAWPDDPDAGAQVLKPHGSTRGEMIFTADDVLQPLRDAWSRRLAADARGRVAVFLGYSARDLDLAPLWDDVLLGAERVVWFTMPDADEQRYVARLLASVAAAGRLSMRVASAAPVNASRDFVEWCLAEGLVTLDPALVALLDAHREAVRWPALTGPVGTAAGPILEALNDIAAARRAYRQRLWHGPARRSALRSLALLTLNHGGPRVARALGLAAVVPSVGPLRSPRAAILRKRVTILANLGRHDTVLRATRRLGAGDVSTLFTLRTASLRVAGSLDDAVECGSDALSRAEAEGHAVRRAHAAYQLGMALMWAGRIEEAEACVAHRFEPVAGVAASRWVAWLDFLTGCLRIHRGSGDDAVESLTRAAVRFTAEGLGDGVVSSWTAMLTAHRLRCDDGAFTATRAMLDDPPMSFGVHYTRGHVLSRVAVALEDAEFAAWHRNDRDAARTAFAFAAGSPYRVHSAMGRLGLARTGVDAAGNAERARAIAVEIGARRLATAAESLLQGEATRELFLP